LNELKSSRRENIPPLPESRRVLSGISIPLEFFRWNLNRLYPGRLILSGGGGELNCAPGEGGDPDEPDDPDPFEETLFIRGRRIPLQLLGSEVLKSKLPLELDPKLPNGGACPDFETDEGVEPIPLSTLPRFGCCMWLLLGCGTGAETASVGFSSFDFDFFFFLPSTGTGTFTGAAAGTGGT